MRSHVKTRARCTGGALARCQAARFYKVQYEHIKPGVRVCFKFPVLWYVSVKKWQNRLISVYRRGNGFSVGGAKIERLLGEKQSRQSNSKYNFMRYVFFAKCRYNGVWGKAPEAWEFSRFLMSKVTLHFYSASA